MGLLDFICDFQGEALIPDRGVFIAVLKRELKGVFYEMADEFEGFMGVLAFGLRVLDSDGEAVPE